MKLKFKNPNGIIRSAFVMKNDLSVSLYINTTHKYIHPDMVFKRENNLEYAFFNKIEHGKQDSVEIIWENEEEKTILNRCSHDHCEKDQLCFLFLDKQVEDYNATEVICTLKLHKHS